MATLPWPRCCWNRGPRLIRSADQMLGKGVRAGGLGFRVQVLGFRV